MFGGGRTNRPSGVDVTSVTKGMRSLSLVLRHAAGVGKLTACVADVLSAHAAR